MRFTNHAQGIASRFRDLVEDAGDSLPVNHFDELSLLIEAGIDTALVEYMEKVADRLENLARDVRKGAEDFD